MEKLQENYTFSRMAARKARKALTTAKTQCAVAAEAAVVLQTVASNVQRMWYENLGRIVSKCLAAVFDDPYELKLVFTQLSNRTQIKFLLERNLEQFDPLSSTGGGVVDMASYALRLAAIMLAAKDQRRLVIADEPFRFVSVDNSRVRLLLERLAEEFDFQMIIITHDEEYEVGKVYTIT